MHWQALSAQEAESRHVLGPTRWAKSHLAHRDLVLLLRPCVPDGKDLGSSMNRVVVSRDRESPSPLLAGRHEEDGPPAVATVEHVDRVPMLPHFSGLGVGVLLSPTRGMLTGRTGVLGQCQSAPGDQAPSEASGRGPSALLPVRAASTAEGAASVNTLMVVPSSPVRSSTTW